MIIGLLILFVFGFVLHYVLLTHLRTEQTRLWESLGKPTLFMNNSISNNMSTQKLIWGKASLKIDDPRLRRLILTNRVFTIIYGIWFIATVLVISQS
jgi:hypothetical protein